MSERVSDERLRVFANYGTLAMADEIAAMAAELIERRAADDTPSEVAGDTIVPHGIEDAVIDVREDVTFASDDSKRYEAELERLAAFVQSRHPSGAVKHIGLMECVPAAMELISEASEWIGRHVRPDDSEPITAEWLESVGFYREADYGGDDGWLAKDFDDGTPDWLTVNPSESEVTIINDDGGSVARDCITRGDLRRLWAALTGSELDERKAGEV